jgi:hypothetical protein
MNNKLTRRDILGGIAGFTSLSLISNFTMPSLAFANEEKVDNIEIKISPPGPNSIKLLERMQNVIGRTNYSGLYGITLYRGNGVYITDVDRNTYKDKVEKFAIGL